MRFTFQRIRSSKSKMLADEGAACRHTDGLVTEKLGKGYHEVEIE